jgi:hypothetical protein
MTITADKTSPAAVKNHTHGVVNHELVNSKHSIVIIDSGIDDHEILAQGILPTAQVVILNQHQDGIFQISAILSKHPVASIQLIAHGSPGSLQLGNSQLNLDSLQIYHQQLQQWTASEILIYGCEVAAGGRGQAFIQLLHQITGANIAASTKKIGNRQHGGSWELEVNIGEISTTLALKPEVKEAYPGVLVNFDPATNLPVGTNPRSVTVGDLNGDKKPDLVAANFNSDNISVLLGNGTGGFGAATNFTVADGPLSVAVGDLNGDGKADLVVANLDSQNISVLLGNGTGGFGAATNFTFGSRPSSVAVGDFDGDTKLDVAVALDSNNVSILLGDGTGGLGTATNFAVGTNPLSVVTGDLNSDGKLDLVTANNGSNNVSVLLGNGTGGFGTATNFAVGANPYAVALGDFTGTGKLDLVTANNGSNDVSVLLGNGTGNFGTATNFTIGNSPYSVVVGDFNSDSKLDIAAANQTNNNVSVLLGNGTGGFATPSNFAVGSSPFSVAAGDFNSDKKQDLATANFFGSNISVLLNTTGINNAPTGLALSATNVNNKVAAGTVIGTFSSIDPDENDIFTYALVSGVDGVDNDAFIIDGNSLKIKNSPDFQTKASYKINVRTTDAGNLTFEKALTINVNDADNPPVPPDPKIPSRLTNPSDDVFNIKSDTAKAKLQVTVTGGSSNQVNELGLFTVDDAKGTINGVAPGAAGYAQAALARSKVIFSAIANAPNGFNTNNLSSFLELNSGDNLRLVLAKNTSFDAVRAGVTPITELQFVNPATQKITNLGDKGFSIAFQDLVVNINQTNQALPLGTNLQGKSQGEVIDLRDAKQSVKADFTVYREASFNNFVGFYQVADENGGIDTNGDGKADILTGQAGYTQAAIRGRVAGIDLTVNNQGTATYTGTFKPGAIFAPFIIIDGKPDAILDTNPNNDPAVYFPFLGSNTDKTDHVRLLGSNIFGFEDLANGGDQDFNDVIVKVNLTAIA